MFYAFYQKHTKHIKLSPGYSWTTLHCQTVDWMHQTGPRILLSVTHMLYGNQVYHGVGRCVKDESCSSSSLCESQWTVLMAPVGCCPSQLDIITGITVRDGLLECLCLLSSSYNWNKTTQNNVLFQTLLHVKQNTETIPKRFGIVLELFQSCFRLINIFIHVLKNMQIPKQFQRSQPITDDHTCITL